MDRRDKAFTLVALALALAVPWTGCARPTRGPTSTQQRCDAQVSRSTALSRQCRAVAQQRCQAKGAVYWPEQQFCEFQVPSGTQ